MSRAATKLASIALFLLSSQPGLALDSDANAPVQIESDHASFDQSRGIAIYSGHVQLNQGSIKIRADKIEVWAKAGKMDKAIISGHNELASFSQTTEAQNTITGKAREITLYQSTADIVFEGDASLEDGRNIISGPFIRYNSKNNNLQANASEDKAGRVKMTFLPAESSEQGAQEEQDTP